jgi:hypothetical protein
MLSTQSSICIACHAKTCVLPLPFKTTIFQDFQMKMDSSSRFKSQSKQSGHVEKFTASNEYIKVANPTTHQETMDDRSIKNELSLLSLCCVDVEYFFLYCKSTNISYHGRVAIQIQVPHPIVPFDHKKQKKRKEGEERREWHGVCF